MSVQPNHSGGPSGVVPAKPRSENLTLNIEQMIRMYVGDTETALAVIFTAAENVGGALLFDEADALLGKRTEVRDSHDRFRD